MQTYTTTHTNNTKTKIQKKSPTSKNTDIQKTKKHPKQSSNIKRKLQEIHTCKNAKIQNTKIQKYTNVAKNENTKQEQTNKKIPKMQYIKYKHTQTYTQIHKSPNTKTYIYNPKMQRTNLKKITKCKNKNSKMQKIHKIQKQKLKTQNTQNTKN